MRLFRIAKDSAGLILMLSMLLLFSSKSLPNIPAGIMALLGFYWFLAAPRLYWANPLFRLLLALFASLWLPMVFSLVDAVNTERAAATTWPYVRFLGMGVFVLHESRKPDLWPKLNLGAFIIITFWCADALLQFFCGWELLGYPAAPGTIYGVFYPEITLGHVVAALSPLYFHVVYTNRKRWPWLWILLIPLTMVVVLSARRAAWIMLVVSMAGYAGFWWRSAADQQRLPRRFAALGAVLALVAVLTVLGDASLRHRIQVTLGLFSGDYATMNEATASRLNLWSTAGNIIQAHWLNGIGPRGYRYVYTQYSAEDDPFHVEGQTHPHQLVLEVWSETGLIGLAGLGVFCVVSFRFLRKNALGCVLFPGCLCVISATFPLNTHMAFYGSYWSSLVWWLILLALGGAAFELEGRKSPAVVVGRAAST